MILKECPFCGNQPVFYDENPLFKITCQECGSIMTSLTVKNLLRRWNYRYIPKKLYDISEELYIRSDEFTCETCSREPYNFIKWIRKIEKKLSKCLEKMHN